MAKLAVDRPFNEGDLHDDLWTHPVSATAWQLESLRERRLRNLERIQPGAQVQQKLCVEACTDLSRKDEVGRFEVPDEQCAETDSDTLWVGEPSNDELLRRFALHLQPVRRATMLVL